MGALLIAGMAFGLWLDEKMGPSWLPGMPSYPCWLVISLLFVVGSCRELLLLFGFRGLQTNAVLSYGGVIALTLANWIPWFIGPAGVASHLAWVFATMCVVNMIVLIREGLIFRQPGQAVITSGVGILTTFYLGGLAAFLIELRWANEGIIAIASLMAAAKGGDIGAYFGGRALGRHKLCPWLSPKKTVEGAVSGLAASVLVTLLVVRTGARFSDNPPALSWLVAASFGLSVGAMAQIGDLIESLIKRDCQQKDASNSVPGFGGILDVLDSPLFSAPLAFGLWHWLGP